jgi:zinc protease
MTLRKHLLLLAALAGGLVLTAPAAETSSPAASAPAAVTVRPWPQDNSDIKPDPTAVFGTLPNGFRYIILPNKEPPGRVSLRLRINAGSFMETEDQRGLAHFTEHMAFNGSKHFPPGELVGYLQKLGMGFGADTNANTSFQRTLYKLDLPDTSDAVLRDSLSLFQDYVDGLLLPQTEIDRERGVILSEKRDRDNVDYRTFVAGWEFDFPDALLPKRQPIGLESVIREAQRDRFASFYQTWYTVDRATLVVVGDVKPDDFIPLIKEYFGPIVARKSPPDPNLGQFGTPGFQAGFHREPEAPAVSIDIATMSPFSFGPDRVARRAKELTLDAANFIISRRLERLTRQANAPIVQGQSYSYSDFDAFQASGIQATCQPAQWHAALDTIEQELRRALQFGFNAPEVNEARAYILNQLQEAAKTADTRLSRGLSDEVAGSLDDNEVYTSPAQDLAMAQPILDALTPQQCLDGLKEAWSLSGRRLFVAGNLDFPDASAVQTLTDAYNKSAAVAVTKPDDNGATEFAYASAGAPGQVVERNDIADLGITQLRFANNVRVNLKKTDFEADKIHVLVQFGGGRLDLPANQPAIAFMADAAFIEGGLGKHSAEDLQRLLAGKTAGADFSAGTNYFDLSGDTNPRDLRLELELLKAYLTDPGYRPDALALVRRDLPALYANLAQNVEAVLSNQMENFLASGDPRFGYPAQAQAEAVTMDDIRAWLAPILRDSYMEISIVGDFDPAATEKALAETFGTLPARAEKRADYTAVLNVKFPVDAAGTVKNYDVPSVIPKAEAVVAWPTTDQSDIQRVRTLGVLAQVFSDRLRVIIRQKLGEAYSPEVTNNSNDVYPQYGYAYALISSDPKLAASLADQARDIGDAIATGGVTQDEFDRAITPLQKYIAEYRRNNIYWLVRVLAGSQAKPRQLDWARTLPTAYDQITPDQVSALAKQYLGAEHAVRILVIPQPPPGATPAAAPADTAPAASSAK